MTLVAEEVGEAGVLNQYIEIIINPGSPQEVIGRPFIWPDLRGRGKLNLGLSSSSFCFSLELRLDEPLKNFFIISETIWNF